METETEIQTYGASVIEPTPDPQYIVTPYIQKLVDHSLAYLRADLPLHYSGPAGCGKSSLAFHVACRLKRPIVVLHGDEEYMTSDLVGAEQGYRKYKLRDQFIHSVIKTEEQFSKAWVDNRLAIACKHGFTLIYDEFTRSRPEANNVLLSALEEKMLDLPSSGTEGNYLKVHPNFRAIFTSNPTEYAGIFKAQDALRDRLMTIDVGRYDVKTEVAILKARTDISSNIAERIVRIVQSFATESAGKASYYTLRHSIKIARVMSSQKKMTNHEEFFRTVCRHVLIDGSVDPKARESVDLLDKILKQFAHAKERR